MVYNYKYKLEWVGLKNADESDLEKAKWYEKMAKQLKKQK